MNVAAMAGMRTCGITKTKPRHVRQIDMRMMLMIHKHRQLAATAPLLWFQFEMAYYAIQYRLMCTLLRDRSLHQYITFLDICAL